MMDAERLYDVVEAMVALADAPLHDEESDHIEADKLLVKALRILAERIDTVIPDEILKMLRAYERLNKWYA